MTLNDIIVSALAQLDRGHDSQTVDTWRDKFTRYANEAAIDLATTLKLRRTDALQVTSGRADLTLLPEIFTKVISVKRDGKELVFQSGPSSCVMQVQCSDGPVDVQYRCLPKDMTSPTEVPDLPAYCHGAIVSYVVARERASQDPSMQRGANVYFELYNAAKRGMRSNAGESDAYEIKNRW